MAEIATEISPHYDLNDICEHFDLISLNDLRSIIHLGSEEIARRGGSVALAMIATDSRTHRTEVTMGGLFGSSDPDWYTSLDAALVKLRMQMSDTRSGLIKAAEVQKQHKKAAAEADHDDAWTDADEASPMTSYMMDLMARRGYPQEESKPEEPSEDDVTPS